MTKARVLLGIFAAVAGIGVAAQLARADGRGAELRMLGPISDGRWELGPRDGGTVQRLCLNNSRRLIQLRHPDLPCERIVLEDSPTSATVQYTCRGRGYGRTHIRRETAQLIQLETQGIADGLPFELNAEGRRIGDCGT